MGDIVHFTASLRSFKQSTLAVSCPPKTRIQLAKNQYLIVCNTGMIHYNTEWYCTSTLCTLDFRGWTDVYRRLSHGFVSVFFKWQHQVAVAVAWVQQKRLSGRCTFPNFTLLWRFYGIYKGFVTDADGPCKSDLIQNGISNKSCAVWFCFL